MSAWRRARYLLSVCALIAAGSAAWGAEELYLLAPTLYRNGQVDQPGHVERILSNGARVALAATFTNPAAMAVDSAGRLYVANYDLTQDRRGMIYRIALDGTVSDIGYVVPDAKADDALNDLYKIDLACSAAGALYVLAPTLHRADGSDALGHVEKITADGTRTVLGPGFANPVAIAVDACDNVYLVDHYLPVARAGSIYRIAPSGQVQSLGPAISDMAPDDALYLLSSMRLACDDQNNLYIILPMLLRDPPATSVPGRLTRIAPDGTRTTFDTTFHNPVAVGLGAGGVYVVEHALDMDRRGSLYTFTANGQLVATDVALTDGAGADFLLNYAVRVAAVAFLLPPTLGVSVTPSNYDVGMADPGETRESQTALVVKNEGNVPEDVGVRVKTQDDLGEWTVGAPGLNVYELSTRFSEIPGAFVAGDVLTTSVQWCDGIKFGGGGNDMPPAATVNQWFEFKAPTAVNGTHAADQHTMTVEVCCRLAE